MKHWTTACPDWERRIVARESLIPFAPLFPVEAERALDFFKSLPMTDLPMVEDRGELRYQTFGEACDQWVFDFVAAIFGAYDAETGKQMITEFFMLISKKNGKSTIAAAIMLTALVLNDRHYAELLILAPTIEIAKNSFGPAAAMVRADPELLDLLHIQDAQRRIAHRNTNAVLMVVAADIDTVGGKKAGFVLVDELWLFGKRANADAMLKEATGGTVSRPEGFTVYLSTHSDAPPTGVFLDKLTYFRDLRDGRVVNPKSLGVLYEYPPAMIERKDYLKPEFFYVTNPNLGRSVPLEWLVEKLGEAQRSGGDSLRVQLAKHHNVEIGMNLRGNRWSGADHWEANTSKTLAGLPTFDALDAILDRSEVAVVGLDGGGLDDLYGVSVLGREPMEFDIPVMVRGHQKIVRMKRYLSWNHAFCHRSVLTLRPKIATKLLEIEKAGQLTIIDQPVEDVANIIEIVSDIMARDLLGGVSVDPAGLGAMVDALAGIGVTSENKLLFGAPQGYGMMDSLKTAERHLASGMLEHCGGPLMAWCVPNLKIEPLATAIRATKQTAGDAKIDPAMAMFNSVTLMLRNPMPQKKVVSVFEALAARRKAAEQEAATA